MKGHSVGRAASRVEALLSEHAGEEGEVWRGSDGFSYDGERLFAYSRGGEG